jgi:hypothetical protein
MNRLRYREFWGQMVQMVPRFRACKWPYQGSERSLKHGNDGLPIFTSKRNRPRPKRGKKASSPNLSKHTTPAAGSLSNSTQFTNLRTQELETKSPKTLKTQREPIIGPTSEPKFGAREAFEPHDSTTPKQQSATEEPGNRAGSDLDTE